MNFHWVSNLHQVFFAVSLFYSSHPLPASPVDSTFFLMFQFFSRRLFCLDAYCSTTRTKLVNYKILDIFLKRAFACELARVRRFVKFRMPCHDATVSPLVTCFGLRRDVTAPRKSINTAQHLAWQGPESGRGDRRKMLKWKNLYPTDSTCKLSFFRRDLFQTRTAPLGYDYTQTTLLALSKHYLFLNLRSFLGREVFLKCWTT